MDFLSKLVDPDEVGHLISELFTFTFFTGRVKFKKSLINMKFGHFTPEALQAFAEMKGLDTGNQDFSEGVFDFKICERPSDGKFYGISDKKNCAPGHIEMQKSELKGVSNNPNISADIKKSFVDAQKDENQSQKEPPQYTNREKVANRVKNILEKAPSGAPKSVSAANVEYMTQSLRDEMEGEITGKMGNGVKMDPDSLNMTINGVTDLAAAIGAFRKAHPEIADPVIRRNLPDVAKALFQPKPMQAAPTKENVPDWVKQLTPEQKADIERGAKFAKEQLPVIEKQRGVDEAAYQKAKAEGAKREAALKETIQKAHQDYLKMLKQGS